MDEIWELWTSSFERQKDSDLAYRELREKLDGLLDAHFRGHGYGAPRTGKALIEQIKADGVDQLGPSGVKRCGRPSIGSYEITPILSLPPFVCSSRDRIWRAR